MAVFYDTVRIKGAQSSTNAEILQIYINSKWPIKSGTNVWFTIRGLNDDVKKIIRVKRRLIAVGTGRKVTCPKQWGFEKNQWVVITVEPIEDE
jgi:hypothetical protein